MKIVEDFMVLLHELQQRYENGEFGTAIFPSVKSDMVKYYNQIRLQVEHGKEARPMIGFR